MTQIFPGGAGNSPMCCIARGRMQRAVEHIELFPEPMENLFGLIDFSNI